MAFSDDGKFLISWLVIQTWSKKIIDTVQEQEKFQELYSGSNKLFSKIKIVRFKEC